MFIISIKCNGQSKCIFFVMSICYMHTKKLDVVKYREGCFQGCSTHVVFASTICDVRSAANILKHGLIVVSTQLQCTLECIEIVI